MLEYLKSVINDSKTGVASSRRFVFLMSSTTLCLGFIVSTIALVNGVPVSDAVIIGLATIIAGLAGGAYTVTKKAEIQKKDSE